MGFGENLKKLRERFNLTQEDIAEIAGVTNKAVSTWETGRKEPRMGAVVKIAKFFGIKVSNLIEDGGMDQIDFKLEFGTQQPVKDLVFLPIVGRISCGNSALAYEDIEGYEPTPKEWLNGEEYFYLRAKGDSMIGARIHDGDLLLIRKQPEVENGEIAVVLIEDEAALKRVFKRDQHLVLQSENPNYPPILAPPTNVKIIGRLKKIVINV